MNDAGVDRGDGRRLDARVVAFDPRNDVAVLRVPGLRGRALRLAEPTEGEGVAILGYPESGPFTASAARIGRTASVLTDDAYGRGPIRRTVTTLRGAVRKGNSGGPAVDSTGRVQTTVFAARIGSSSGYGVPPASIRRVLGRAKGNAVSSGPCVR
jgi:S1-C subfamily serine protease